MAFASFHHADRDIALDPLSTNRRLHTYIPVVESRPVELRLGSPFDMGRELPPPDLALRLTPNSQTLQIQRRAYWDEINPLLQRWRSVNDARCPECARIIRVNMSRHMRLTHTMHACYWRSPVPSCPLWFTSELNGKDHIENIHHFREGRATRFTSASGNLD